MSRKSDKKQSAYNNRQVRPDYLYQKNEPAVSLKVTGAMSSTKKNNYLINFFLLLFFCCGVFSSVRIIKNFSGVNIDEIFVFAALALFSFVIWIVSMLPKIKAWHIFLTGIVLSGLMFFIFYGKILTQINIIIGLIIWSPPFIGLIDITHSFLLCAMLGTLIFYMLTFCGGKGWLLILVCAPFIIISPIFEIEISLIDLFLLGIYFVGSFAIGSVHNPSKRKKRKVHRLSASERMSAGGSGAAILMALFFIFSVLAYTFASPRMESLYEIPMDVETVVQQAISSVVSVETDNGSVNKGNNYSFGQKHLEIISSKQPQSPLYLKNYTGGYYNNGRWNTVNESSFFANIYDGNEYSLICNNPYYALLNLAGDDDSQAMEVKVKSFKSLVTGTCIPVLSKETGTENGYTTYSCYELSYLLDCYENGSLDIFNDIYEEYTDYTDSTYMYVPEDKIPRIVELCKNSGVKKGDYDAATNFILNTFSEMVSYTTTPGNAPSGVDITEYFLFDNGKGYCQQYATTAALMYRLLGLPSRYVTGYMVTPSDFVQNSDGTFTAIATDEKNHAWVEVYVEGIGWIPTEVTFSQEEIEQGGISADNTDTGEDTTEDPTSDTEPTESTTEPSEETENTTEPPSDPQDSSDTSANNSKTSGIDGSVLKTVIIVLSSAAAVILAVILFRTRRKRNLASLKRMKPNLLFVKMIDMIHLGGYLKECRGTEPDFPERLSNLVSEMSLEEADEFVNLANKAAFGNKSANIGEKQTAYSYYSKAAVSVYGKLKFFKKFYFKYIKVYY